MIGRWSLPMLGPQVTLESIAMDDDAKKRSIVDDFPLDGSIRVPKSHGVTSMTLFTSLSTFHRELPPRFALEFPIGMVSVKISSDYVGIGTGK